MNLSMVTRAKNITQKNQHFPGFELPCDLFLPADHIGNKYIYAFLDSYKTNTVGGSHLMAWHKL